VQQRLPPPAGQVARLAVALDLPDVAADGFPSLDLAPVFVRHPAAHVIAAIPLKPAPRVVRMKPRQVLGGLHAAVACSLRRYNAHAIDIS
jgi:hypothetical protein